MTEDIIKKINDKCPSNQGIFREPYGIPTHIKDLVIYGRYQTGGVSGGSCWDSSNPQSYWEPEPEDRFKVLEIVLDELCPNIKYLEFRKIQCLIKSNDETEYEYYGNSTDWKCEYIILSDLESLIETFGS